MSDNKNVKIISIYGQMICAAAAGCTADVFTHPVDTIKVWLQTEKNATEVKKRTDQTKASQQLSFKFPISSSSKSQIHCKKSPTIVRTIAEGIKNNGISSLYGGIVAGLQRQIAFCGVRLGIYDSVKMFYTNLFCVKKENKHVEIKLLAGTTSGLIAVLLFQPTEVVKIRMQAQARSSKTKRLYSSTLNAYKQLFEGGFRSAWQGFGVNATRMSVVNMSELVTYDVIKELILEYGFLKNNIYCHFTSAFIGGLVTTILASPIDVVKTKYMNSQQGMYAGVFSCAKLLLINEGPLAFYKGFLPSFTRLGLWNIVMWISYEQYKIIWNQFIFD